MNNNPIGILDSGLGGLTIWNEVITQLPHESTVYIADSLNSPYGSKDKNQIYTLAKRMIKFLVLKNVKIILIACNTITVTCLDELRSDFPNIPIIGIVPVVKMAAAKTKSGKIGVLSTTRTAESSYQKKLIKEYAHDCEVFVHGTDELVPLIEKGTIEGREIEKILQKVLKKFRNEGVDTLALGCSHFPFLEKEITKILGTGVLLLDSSGAVARQVKRVLDHNSSIANGEYPKHKFFTTGELNSFKKIANYLEKNYLVNNIDRIEL